MQGLQILTSHFSFPKGTGECASPMCGSKPKEREIMDLTGKIWCERQRESWATMTDDSCEPIQTEANQDTRSLQQYFLYWSSVFTLF